MNILTLDVETTTYMTGNPFSRRNKLCYVGLKWFDNTITNIVNYQIRDTELSRKYIQKQIDNADIIVGFNLKFDIHWLMNIGVSFENVKQLWDCQIAEFLLESQQNPYNSLNNALTKYGKPGKLDIVKTEYWDRGCSCHVSVVEKIVNTMQKIYVLPVIAESMSREIDLKGMLIRGNGEKIIQNYMRQLKEGDLKNYVLTLKQRLEQDEQKRKEPTTLLTLNMIDLWLKQCVEFVEQNKTYVLTMTIKHYKPEICYVDHVMLLWDILKKQIGWKQHTSTCNNIPIDTPDIPEQIVVEYLDYDCIGTESVFIEQAKQFGVKL